MKKLFLAVAAAVFTLASCGGNNNQTNEDAAIRGYFPLITNAHYYYESPGRADFAQDVYNTYLNGDIIQRRAASAKIATTEVLRIQNGAVTLIYGDPHYYFYEDITSAAPNTQMILLKEPFEKGQKWTQDASGQCEITGMDVPVITPSGNYNAMEVTTTFSDGRSQKEYYAKGVGLVKTAYKGTDGSNIEISLVKIEKNAALTVPVDFYYPDANQPQGFGKDEKDIDINTNSDLVKLINNQMKTAGTTGYVWLPGNTAINSINVDRANDILVADFSDDTGVNTQNGLQAIANTLGQFYGVSKVRPTVKGGNYTAEGKSYGPSDSLTVIAEPDQAAAG